MEIIKASVEDLKEYHNNPRKGNVDLIAESLSKYGQYKPITVSKQTGEILAGNHTFRAAKKLGWAEIDVVYVDVDNVTAAKIVAIDNRASDMGEYDKQVLADLLDSMNNLDGSGYTFDEYDDLKAEIQEASMPELEHKTYFSSLEVGETGQSGTRFIPSLGDYAERYINKATRMLMCDYHNDTYVWIVEALIEYRTANDITSNAEAILRLVENAVGRKSDHETI
jgi:hypothetical protein